MHVLSLNDHLGSGLGPIADACLQKCESSFHSVIAQDIYISTPTRFTRFHTCTVTAQYSM